MFSLSVVQDRPAPAIVSVWELAAGGPSDTANATSTSPGTVVLNAAVVRLPRPSEKIIRSTAGTPVVAGPVDTTIATALFCGTLLPATGAWLITLPAGTVALFALVTAPTVNPTPVIVDCAVAWSIPTTLGTVTSPGPSDRVNDTGLFSGARAPPPGLWLMTCPLGAGEFATLIVPTASPAAAIAPCAGTDVNPITLGTVVMFATVTTTDAEVAVLPAASCATALRLWLPSAPSVVSQNAWNGGACNSGPIGVAPSKKLTPVTPMLSEADALTSTSPDTVPPSGAAMLTLGAATSGAATVTMTLTTPIAVCAAASRIS